VTIESDIDSSLIDEGLPAKPPRSSISRRVTSLFVVSIEKFSGIYAILIFFLIFAVWVPDTFLTATTWRSILSEQAVTAMLAFGLLFPLLTGLFDLSVAATLGFSGVFTAWLSAHHMNSFAAAGVALLATILVGVVNAIAVVMFKVSSFIATLGMSSVLAALAIAITDNVGIITGVSNTFQKTGNVTPAGIPIVAYYMVVLGAIVWWFIERTPKGRFFAAIGGNQEASRLAGLRVNRYLAVSLVVSAFVGGLAGVIYLAQVGSSSQDAGPPFLLPTFAAVLLGATQIKPGRYNVLGTLVAVFLLAIGVKGLQLVGSPAWVSLLFDGAALVLAVALANLRRKPGTLIT
jgi:ribose transport system permease protein